MTGPAAVHVKFVDCAFGVENVPLGADHEYVTAPGFGAVAVVAERTTLPPTVVSDGLAATPLAVAQLNVSPPIATDPESAAALLQRMSTLTFVVVLAVTENVADPGAR